MSESRKRRVARTKHNLVHVKERVNAQVDVLRSGSMERNHVEAVVHVEKCGYCKEKQSRIASLTVWSRTAMDILDPWQMTSQILAKGMYEFHSDLPIRTITRDIEIPICADCIVKHMQEDRQWKGE